MRLYQHQQSILKKNPKKTLLAWSTGTGKSLAGIELLKKNARHTPLIVCPKSIKSKWIADVPDSWLVLTKEEFKKQSETLGIHSLLIDEAHHFSGITSQLSKEMIKYIKRVNPNVIYLLTATPYLSSAWNIYTLAKMLGYDWGYQAFKKKYFDMVYMGRRRIPVQKKKVDGVPMKDHIANVIKKIGDTVSMEDCFDVPEQTFLVEEFQLTAEQKRAIKEIDDPEQIVFWTKQHQICGGTLKDVGEFRNEKIARIKELANEHKKLIIVARYNNERDYICRQLSKYNVHHISADTKDVAELAKLADSQDEAILVISAAISEGYELPSFPIMVF